MKNFSQIAPKILLVEDDPDDQELIKRVLGESKIRNHLIIVEDGEQALDYLMQKGEYSDSSEFPQPDLILLDLNLPKVDGKHVLQKIKSDPKLRRLPVIVLTTSSEEEDIARSYDMGSNSYITKPLNVEMFINAINILEAYWFQTVILPKS